MTRSECTQDMDTIPGQDPDNFPKKDTARRNFTLDWEL